MRSSLRAGQSPGQSCWLGLVEECWHQAGSSLFPPSGMSEKTPAADVPCASPGVWVPKGPRPVASGGMNWAATTHSGQYCEMRARGSRYTLRGTQTPS